VRPLWSTIVTDSMSGRRTPFSSNTCSIATSAARRFSVSVTVSGISRSTPPSMRPRTCSA
jgi:hypothetical protein